MRRPQPGIGAGRTFSVQCYGGGTQTHTHTPTDNLQTIYIYNIRNDKPGPGHRSLGVRGARWLGWYSMRIRTYDKLTHVKETFIFSAKSTHNRTCTPDTQTHIITRCLAASQNRFHTIRASVRCGMVSARMRVNGAGIADVSDAEGGVRVRCGGGLGVIVVCAPSLLTRASDVRPDRNSQNRFSARSRFLFPCTRSSARHFTRRWESEKIWWRNTFVILFK